MSPNLAIHLPNLHRAGVQVTCGTCRVCVCGEDRDKALSPAGIVVPVTVEHPPHQINVVANERGERAWGVEQGQSIGHQCFGCEQSTYTQQAVSRGGLRRQGCDGQGCDGRAALAPFFIGVDFDWADPTNVTSSFCHVCSRAAGDGARRSRRLAFFLFFLTRQGWSHVSTGRAGSTQSRPAR